MPHRVGKLRKALEKTEDYLAEIVGGVKAARKARRWDALRLFLSKEEELHHVIGRYESQLRAAKKLPAELRAVRRTMPTTADLDRKGRAMETPVGHLRGRHGPIQPQKSRYSKRKKK